MFKFCPNCTKEAAPGWKCCPYCGFKFEEIGTANNDLSSTGSALDNALGNLMGLVNEKQTENKLRALIIRGRYDEAEKLCNTLIDNDPMDKVGYIGLIRLVSKNYKLYEGDDIAEQIRVAEEIFGADELLFDSEYANYISARKQYFEEQERKRIEAEKAEAERKRIEEAIEYASKRLFLVDNRDGTYFLSGVRSDSYDKNKPDIEIVVIPDKVTSIGEFAFKLCKSLKSVAIPNSVKSIGKEAFGCCEHLTSVTIPNSVKSIGEFAFWSCEALTSITIPDSVTSIGEKAFWCCRSLTNVSISGGVTSIGISVFERCKSLTSITIPDSVTSIGANAFYKCESLTSVTIPDSVKSIGRFAFFDCLSLKSVSIPNGCRYESNSFPDDCEIIRR